MLQDGCLPLPWPFSVPASLELTACSAFPSRLRQSCAAGTYQPLNGSTSCTDCPPGNFSSAGAKSCPACAVGTAATGAATAVCTPCEPGSYAAAGSAACLPCPPGFYSMAWRSAACTVSGCCRQPALEISVLQPPRYGRPREQTWAVAVCVLCVGGLPSAAAAMAGILACPCCQLTRLSVCLPPNSAARPAPSRRRAAARRARRARPAASTPPSTPPPASCAPSTPSQASGAPPPVRPARQE